MSGSMYFLPPRILQITINTITPYAYWTDGGMGSTSTPPDPWVGFPYQWTVDFTVTPQLHSSHLTATPFYYTGTDILVGDWFADISQGLSVQIVQILTQTQSELTVIVEDVDRFNTFTDPTQSGNGIGNSTGPTASAYLFSLNDEGVPILAPMTNYSGPLQTNVAFQQDQIGRFMYRNYLKSFYMVYQPGQTFNVGDLVVLSPQVIGNTIAGSYSLVTANTSAVKAIVGQVSSTGAPGPNYFAYRPVGRVVTTLDPTLPGLPGDLIYLSANGMVNYDNVATVYSNTSPTAWATPIFIQLEAPNAGISLNRGVDTAGSIGYGVKSLVVADHNAANAVISTLNPGDHVMINNAGYGEWTHTINVSGNLRQVATQDSAHVDAESLEVTITANTVLSNIVTGNTTMSGVLMGNVSTNRSITSVNVQVNQVFDANTVMSVGTANTVDQIITNTLVDLTMLGSYAYTPTFEVTTPGYTPIYTFINFNGTNIGNATITVSYL